MLFRSDNVNATISSRSTYAGGDTAGTTTLLTRIASALTLASGAVTVGTNNDKTGYALSSASVQAIWDALTSALTTVGSIGKRLVDNLTGDIFARVGAPIGASISADIAGVQSDTDNIQTRIPAALVAGRMDANVGAIAANAITAASINAAALNGKGDWSTVAGIIAGVSEGALNLQGMLRVILAACAGKSNSHESGAPKYRDTADLKNRISATTDANGNRTSIVLDDT